MNDLISVNFETEHPTVSARELHEQLNIEKRFSAWFTTNSKGFVNGEDFTSVLLSTEVQNNGGVQVREMQDYNLTFDMAKHICLMSRTEKGKVCRQYFIELEKAWNSPQQVMARALKLADKTINTLRNKLDEQEPLVYFANKVSESSNLIDIGRMAKLLKDENINIGRNRLFNWLRHKEILMKNNVPYQRYVDGGYFEIKESVFTTPYGVKTNTTTYITGKGQIYITEKLRKEWNK